MLTDKLKYIYVSLPYKVLLQFIFFQAYPVFFILMENKTVQAYRTILEFIKTCAPGLRPELIITDFERAIQQSVQEAFPESQVVGCWFHSANVSNKYDFYIP